MSRFDKRVARADLIASKLNEVMEPDGFAERVATQVRDNLVSKVVQLVEARIGGAGLDQVAAKIAASVVLRVSEVGRDGGSAHDNPFADSSFTRAGEALEWTENGPDHWEPDENWMIVPDWTESGSDRPSPDKSSLRMDDETCVGIPFGDSDYWRPAEEFDAGESDDHGPGMDDEPDASVFHVDSDYREPPEEFDDWEPDDFLR